MTKNELDITLSDIVECSEKILGLLKDLHVDSYDAFMTAAGGNPIVYLGREGHRVQMYMSSQQATPAGVISCAVSKNLFFPLRPLTAKLIERHSKKSGEVEFVCRGIRQNDEEWRPVEMKHYTVSPYEENRAPAKVRLYRHNLVIPQCDLEKLLTAIKDLRGNG